MRSWMTIIHDDKSWTGFPDQFGEPLPVPMITEVTD